MVLALSLTAYDGELPIFVSTVSNTSSIFALFRLVVHPHVQYPDIAHSQTFISALNRGNSQCRENNFSLPAITTIKA
jgi:hypothetical protein